MYKICIQMQVLLSDGTSPWYSEGHAKCKHVTWSTETDIRLREVKCIEIIGIHSNMETDHQLMFLVIKL